VEGSINLPGNRVTVGRNGVVAANISAREIVVLGKVRGNMTASDRVDLRGEGSLTGDVVAQRISIEDGAYFKGGIDIRKPGQKANGESKETTATTAGETGTSAAAARVKSLRERDCGQTVSKLVYRGCPKVFLFLTPRHTGESLRIAGGGTCRRSQRLSKEGAIRCGKECFRCSQ
jgi:hypothetical protein